MKYKSTIEIELPRAKVIAFFDDPEGQHEWMKSLISLERIEGEAGQVGTKTRLKHKMGAKEVEMLETVTERKFPELFIATYEAKGVWNQAVNRFVEISNYKTRWVLESEFRCTGVMWLLTKILPVMFKKQTQAVMEAFKAYAEGKGDK